MSYTVKEIVYTLQGEGAQSGRAAVFCRFTGCNLWSGLEKDRQDAICNFCDTDFVGGIRCESVAALVNAIQNEWVRYLMSSPYRDRRRDQKTLVVCTGGEPLLQMNAELVQALHDHDFEVAIETNGTKTAPPGIDWICVSPKANAELVLKAGHELIN